VTLDRDLLRIDIRSSALRAIIGGDAPAPGSGNGDDYDEEYLTLELPIAIRRRGAEAKLIITEGADAEPRHDPRLISNVCRAIALFEDLKNGTSRSVRDLSRRHAIAPADVSRLLPLALLAPDIVEAIVDGRQPVELTAVRLKRRIDLPASWAAQRSLLGFV
jgi:hypothetical protein